MRAAWPHIRLLAGLLGLLFAGVFGMPASVSAFTPIYTYDTATYTYGAPVLLSPPDTATSYVRVSPSGPGDVGWGKPASVARDVVAANTAGTAGRELTTYYPPNRGFLGSSSRQTLEAGTRIDRYGREGGTFASPAGTPLEMRALPPGAGARPYNVYEVVEPFTVDAGTVAPWHGQLGLGTQYELPGSVADLIGQGFLKAVN